MEIGAPIATRRIWLAHEIPVLGVTDHIGSCSHGGPFRMRRIICSEDDVNSYDLGSPSVGRALFDHCGSTVE
jgi:hypothetical protein